MTTPTEPTIINFFPKFFQYDPKEYDGKIAEYRAWLDQHGDYGRLYMVDIGKAYPTDINRQITGLRIFHYDIAVLFKLMFEV